MAKAALTLGFDTSLAHCGAALLVDGECVGALYEDMAKGQAERLMPMLDEVLAQGGASWRDLTRIGVGIGPGNFTGIRISVSAARGLALGLGIPAIGVTLLDALAFGTEGARIAMIDARRDHLYLKGFGGVGPSKPGLFAAEDMDRFHAAGVTCLGNCSAERIVALGGVQRPAAYAPASAIARIAATRDVVPGLRPAPLYLRAPDAAPSRHGAPTLAG